ncbi:MAG TPA: hypothetical protein VFP42_12070 [Acidimicrobiia bacterium]|nr:hypothetical protein [Acidimicrobiia bacterium]
MTVLHGNTAGQARSNRFGKFMVGAAMVAVGIGAAFGISQLIDSPSTAGTVTPAHPAVRSVDAITGNVATRTPSLQADIAAKNALEGHISSSVGTQMQATVEAGMAQLAAFNEAARLQALNEWGRAYGAQLAEAARLEALNEWGEAYGAALAGANGASWSLQDELDAIRNRSVTSAGVSDQQAVMPKFNFE